MNDGVRFVLTGVFALFLGWMVTRLLLHWRHER